MILVRIGVLNYWFSGTLQLYSSELNPLIALNDDIISYGDHFTSIFQQVPINYVSTNYFSFVVVF